MPSVMLGLNKVLFAQGSRVSGDLLEVLAEKLVLSGQLLISMIEELKRNAALNDFAVLNQNIARQDAVNETKAAELHAQLTSLQEQLLAQQVCHAGMHMNA